jgi:hypothetical protein
MENPRISMVLQQLGFEIKNEACLSWRAFSFQRAFRFNPVPSGNLQYLKQSD